MRVYLGIIPWTIAGTNLRRGSRAMQVSPPALPTGGSFLGRANIPRSGFTQPDDLPGLLLLCPFILQH